MAENWKLGCLELKASSLMLEILQVLETSHASWIVFAWLDAEQFGAEKENKKGESRGPFLSCPVLKIEPRVLLNNPTTPKQYSQTKLLFFNVAVSNYFLSGNFLFLSFSHMSLKHPSVKILTLLCQKWQILQIQVLLKVKGTSLLGIVDIVPVV